MYKSESRERACHTPRPRHRRPAVKLFSVPARHSTGHSGLKGGDVELALSVLCLLGQEAPRNQRAATCSYKPPLAACPALCWAAAQASNKKPQNLLTGFQFAGGKKVGARTRKEMRCTAGKRELKRSARTLGASSPVENSGAALPAAGRGAHRNCRGGKRQENRPRGAEPFTRNHQPSVFLPRPPAGSALSVARETPLPTVRQDTFFFFFLRGRRSEGVRKPLIARDLRLISPTRPWLPLAATGQLTPVSSFSHLVTLREDAEPSGSPPPAARGSTQEDLQAPQQAAAPEGRCRTDIRGTQQLLLRGSRVRTLPQEPAMTPGRRETETMRRGKTIRAGSWARNNRPWILAEDPDAHLTSFTPALPKLLRPSRMLPTQVPGQTPIRRQQRTQTGASRDQRVTGLGTIASLHPRAWLPFARSPSFARQKAFNYRLKPVSSNLRLRLVESRLKSNCLLLRLCQITRRILMLCHSSLLLH